MIAEISKQREFLKYVAIVTMCVDHAGQVLLPDYIWLRYIGRLAFPLYAYLIATGYDLTRNRNRYLLRLFLLACMSQLGFMLYHPWWQLNIIFTFCLAVAALQSWRTNRKGKIVAASIAGLTIIISWFSMSVIQWGFIGFFTVISFRIMKWHEVFGTVFFLALMTVPFILWAVLLNASCWYQPLAILALPIIWWSPNNFRYRINPWLWRLFYPFHWFFLALFS
ncbi:MAG: hypothetical protein JW936_06935 [Sedimentisphaerales bacterium]|nr:hypothetical protein [Sedimentisphaerales bacterium]